MRKIKGLIISLATLALMAGPALAQPAPGWQGPADPGPGPGPGMMSGPPGFQPGGPMIPYHHHGWHHGYPPPGYRWHRGDRFYGPPPMVIHNYGHYNLAPPPPGYYWVQSGGQFLMIAIASGIIASILTAPMH